MKLKSILLAVLIALVSQVSLAADDAVWATLDGKNFTQKEVMEKVVEQMLRSMKKDKLYNMQRRVLDNMIDDVLLEKEAKKQGITVSQLRKKIRDGADKVTESDARMVYEIQKKRFRNSPFEKVKSQLITQLTAQKKQLALGDFIEGLRKKSKLAVKLERPRTKVSVDDDPVIGKKDAPITIVEFSEFQCPFCKRARPTMDKILSTYGDKVRYTFRDFPLSFHKQATAAANAAHCAGDQNKYWEYSDKLWESQGKHTSEKLREIATSLKLDMGKFDSCVESQKYYAEIKKDQEDGARAGVTGTPAYFINGIFMSGAQPYENFKEIIDEELATKKN